MIHMTDAYVSEMGHKNVMSYDCSSYIGAYLHKWFGCIPELQSRPRLRELWGGNPIIAL
jgi:hypothetical protein